MKKVENLMYICQLSLNVEVVQSRLVIEFAIQFLILEGIFKDSLT